MLTDSPTIHEAYIAFGGNIGDVEDAIKHALSLLVHPPIIDVVATSPLYRTPAVGGPVGQPDFVNGVARVRTTLSPHGLLDQCLNAERQLGRIRAERWGPRTIDLDLILYDDVVIDEPGLTLPHPRMRERLFVLVPLTDVAPAKLRLPGNGTSLSEVVGNALRAENVTASEFRKKNILTGPFFGTINEL